jgi:hypothetical protein
MKSANKPDVSARFADSKQMERIFREAVREAVLRHKRLGESIAEWRDGRVVIVPPDEIPEDGGIDPHAS